MLKIEKTVFNDESAVPVTRWWITGETYPHREMLKEQGCEWSGKRCAWYLTAPVLPPVIADLGVVTSKSPKIKATTQPRPAQKPTAPSEPVAKIVYSATNKMLIERLRKMADGMDSVIAKLSIENTQNSTPKRDRQAESKRSRRQAAELLQSKIRALADAHENDSIAEILAGVKSKRVIERMIATYGAPDPTFHRVALEALDKYTKGKPGRAVHNSLVDACYRRLGDDHGGSYFKLYGVQEAKAMLALQAIATKAGAKSYENIGPDLGLYIEVMELGITTKELWAEAVTAMKALGDPSKGQPTVADQIRVLSAAVSHKTIPGYFPTPHDLVVDLLDAARLPDGVTVLEPSAGKGNIADVLRDERYCAVDCIEPNYHLREILKLKGHNIIGEDFLDWNGMAKYIMMNPPFENMTDAEHLQWAYDHLEDGGIVASIMSPSPHTGSTKKAKDFQDWFESVGGEKYDVKDGAFKHGERQTGVACVIVVIRK